MLWEVVIHRTKFMPEDKGETIKLVEELSGLMNERCIFMSQTISPDGWIVTMFKRERKPAKSKSLAVLKRCVNCEQPIVVSPDEENPMCAECD